MLSSFGSTFPTAERILQSVDPRGYQLVIMENSVNTDYMEQAYILDQKSSVARTCKLLFAGLKPICIKIPSIKVCS